MFRSHYLNMKLKRRNFIRRLNATAIVYRVIYILILSGNYIGKKAFVKQNFRMEIIRLVNK